MKKAGIIVASLVFLIFFLSYEKKSYRLTVDKKMSLLGMRKDDDWILHALYDYEEGKALLNMENAIDYNFSLYQEKNLDAPDGWTPDMELL